jgi:hypothetical protein
VSDPVRFLGAFAQALASMALYADGHPQRERAIDAAFTELQDLQRDTPRPLFTFLGDEIVYGKLPLRDMKAWDWAPRLANAGVQRLEFEDRVDREEFQGFLEEVLARLTLSSIDTTEARQMRRSSIKFGTVGVRGDPEAAKDEELPTATISFSLGEEADTMRWIHQEVQSRGTLPLAEAEAVVRSLSVAMHGGRQVMLPLLRLRDRRAAPRRRQDAHPARDPDQARQIHRRGARPHEPASRRWGPPHPGFGGGPRGRGRGRLRASHHAERRRLPAAALSACLPPGQ